MPRVLIYITVVSVLMHNAQVSSDLEDDSSIEEPLNAGSSEIKVYEELFKKEFIQQRQEHAGAIKRLRNVDSYERLYKMIMILVTKMIDVIKESKRLIESADFNPTDRSLPKNVTIQSAISTTLENTALFGDILLHFPHITHRILKIQKEWNPVISWTVNFTNQAKHLIDTETITLVHLAAQELNIIERKPGFVNPYWKRTIQSRSDEEEKKKKKANSTKRKKLQRGPRILKTEL